MNRNEIYALLEQALAETQKGAAVIHPFSPTLPLVGKDGVLDSLDAMIFLDKTDDLLKEKTGRDIMLAGEEAFSREQTPFATMQTLADFIEELLSEA